MIMMQMERDSGCFPNYWDTQSGFVIGGRKELKSWYGMQIFVTNGLLHFLIKLPDILP
jgi:hypothetical protein